MSKEQIEIQELVRWALVDQCVEQAVAAVRKGFAVGGGLTNIAKIERMLQLGCIIDGHGPTDSDVVMNCHVDAVEVYDAVVRLPNKARDLVYFHAKKKTEPDWLEEGVGALVPKLGKNGKPIPMFKGQREQGDQIGRCDNVGYLMTFQGYPPHEVNKARAEYEVWWQALAALQLELKNNLTAYNPQPTTALRQPWAYGLKKVG